ncbi:tetratricopeptide repeat protein [Pigmentiphaga aceris]|uniref:protein O-GlcNAc transferase n=1 Tax=Pigmentiphaga aceris TaxID=1940612 RepID=A0A5C0ASM0_9BURK|nr:tetratricopeptide repeat protein [Pigmentiphaga aceris]QEI05272.1 tetratricopeptide repeat protein [Pigmentiphaga aceris]
MNQTTHQAQQPDVDALWQCAQHQGTDAALQLAQAQLATHGRHPALLQPVGQLLLMAGRDAEALPWLEAACAARPDDLDAWNQRALVLSHLHRHTDAHTAYQELLRLAPTLHSVFVNIGSNLNHARRFQEAETWLRKGLALAPDAPELKANLVAALVQQGKIGEAAALINALEKIGYQPVELLEAKATLLQRMGRYVDAERLVRQVLVHVPQHVGLLRLLANVVGYLGRPDEQLALYEQVLTLAPEQTEVRSSLLFLLNYAAHSDGPSLLAQATQYGEQLRVQFKQRGHRAYSTWHCEAQPARLRVGLVSGDLRNHPVGYFLDDVIPAMAASGIELFAYANQIREDELTQRMKPHFSAWCDIAALDDEQAARRIHDDGIHILVDLSGHSDQHRLPLFTWKAAPVQASWLGYLGTTGLQEIDWVISDRYMAPEHAASDLVEKIWRMPDSYVHLSRPANAVALTGAPSATLGHVTFGNFNNPAKMTDVVVALWARVLHAVPGSRLFMKNPQFQEPAVIQHTLARYAAYGIGAERLILEGPSPRADLLAAYNRVDIALDPFPYTGGTTSLEALYMSVPVLSLRGGRFMSRMADTLLMNAGLSDWIADDADHFVQLAVSHAADRATLGRLRAGELREQVLASALMDTTRFARDVEQTFRDIWAQWVEKHIP